MIVGILLSLLISNALTLNQERSILFSRIVVTGFILASVLSYYNIYAGSLSKGVGIYGGLFNITAFTLGFNLFILIVSAIILLLTSFYPRKVLIPELSSPYNLLFTKWIYNNITILNKTGEQYRIIEYALVIVFVLCGSLLLMSTGDLISIFLSIELQSYGLYILCTLYRDSESSTASGLTYFLLGGLSSCFILLGSALLYAISGTTNLDNIYIISSISEIPESEGLHNFSAKAPNINNIMDYPKIEDTTLIMTDTNNIVTPNIRDSIITNTNRVNFDSMDSIYSNQPYYYQLSLIIMSVGFLFKISAAPFHFWSPEVYDGIPTIVTTFVAIIAKISIFAFFLELVYYTEYNVFNFSWKSIFLLSSLLSLIIGSVLGLTQSRIKRLLAYSTISHVGFILLALSINTTESIQAYIFYILQYTLSNLNAFVLLITIGFTFYLYVYKDEKAVAVESKNELKDRNNSPLQIINQIKGYFYLNSFIAISLGITLFSFVGIPPLVGFFAKQMVLSAALDAGYVFMSLVAVITSVIGAGYYLSLIKDIFFHKPDSKLNPALIKESEYIRLIGYKNFNPNTLLPNKSIDYNTKPALYYSESTNNFNKETKVENKNVISSSAQNVKVFEFSPKNITVSGSLSSIISISTLLLTLFIFMPAEWFNIVSILTLSLYGL